VVWIYFGTRLQSPLRISSLQMDYLILIQNHWFRQGGLYHKCLWSSHLNKEARFFENLEGLKEIVQNHKWILGGDFKIILSLAEKRGGIHRLENDSEGYKNCIEALSLVDI
jgi:hypothetical protein